MSWGLQQTYLDGLDQEEDIPFSRSKDVGQTFRPGEDMAPGVNGPTIRENVDTGVKVIDLAAMREELENNPDSRRRR
jgi:hypothetical protein